MKARARSEPDHSRVYHDEGRIADASPACHAKSTTQGDQWIVAAAVDNLFITAEGIRAEMNLNVCSASAL